MRVMAMDKSRMRGGGVQGEAEEGHLPLEVMVSFLI